MDIQKIKELALANGFKLKEQASGNMDLNAYVYDFANAVEREVKAQAVPDLGELQERIAGHQYYHYEHGHMIVDMDDVVKEISGFDSWKAQAVPEGFVLVAIDDIERICRCLDDHAVYITYKASDALESIQKAMIEAQGPAND